MTNNSWTNIKLEEIIDNFIVPMRDKPKEFSGDIPWCRIEDFNGIFLSKSKSNRTVSEKIIKEMNLKIYPVGTVLVSCSADLGRCAITSNPLVTNQTFIGLVPSPKVNNLFLYYLMSFSASRLNELSSGTTISYLSRNQFQNFKATIPLDINVQQKIADILSKLDEAIQKTDQIIQKTELLKQGLMQELFDETEKSNWKLEKLGDVTNFIDYRGKTPKKFNSGISLITAKNVKMGYVDPEPKEYIKSEDYDTWMTRGIPKKGDVLFTTEAPLGNIAQLETNEKVAFAQRVIIIQPKSGLDSTFLKYLLMSTEFQGGIGSLSTGGTVKGIKAKVLKQINIPIPPLEEQNKISSILSSIHSKVEKEKENRKLLFILKNGLMQDIFSQKVRVN